MATWVDIMAFGASREAVDGALERVHGLEKLWSRFLPTSDVSRLNAALGDPVAVSTNTILLIKMMQEGHRLSAGRFDPSILPALVGSGYYASINDRGAVTLLPADAESAGCRMDAIVIDETLSTVQFPRGLSLDPGGIGKGLAGDLVVAELLAAGASGAMVNLGGDLAIGGSTPDGRGWPVQITDPHHVDEALLEFCVSAGGVATSSSKTRTWTTGGETRHHTIDPATNASAATDIASVTVTAGSAAEAEIHATTTLILGSQDGLDYLESRSLHGVIVANNRRLVATQSLASQWHSTLQETSI